MSGADVVDLTISEEYILEWRNVFGSRLRNKTGGDLGIFQIDTRMNSWVELVVVWEVRKERLSIQNEESLSWPEICFRVEGRVTICGRQDIGFGPLFLRIVVLVESFKFFRLTLSWNQKSNTLISTSIIEISNPGDIFLVNKRPIFSSTFY
jgi:hypothetical protein